MQANLDPANEPEARPQEFCGRQAVSALKLYTALSTLDHLRQHLACGQKTAKLPPRLSLTNDHCAPIGADLLLFVAKPYNTAANRTA